MTRKMLTASLATAVLTLPAAARPDHGAIDFSATHKIVFDLNSPDVSPTAVNHGLLAARAPTWSSSTWKSKGMSIRARKDWTRNSGGRRPA